MDEDLLAALRALADPTRIRILARLATKPADVASLAAELRISMPAANRNLEVLAAAGLVERREDRPGTVGARLDRVGELGRSLAALEHEAAGAVGGPESGGGAGSAGGPESSGAAGSGDPRGGLLRGAWPHDGETLADTIARLAPTPEEAKTLRAYLVDGRLVTIPAQDKKRQVVLRFLVERVFAEDRSYPEKEVNQRLALFHPDVASLRRYLVDHGYVDREAGLYRRHGPRSPLPQPVDP